MSPEMHPKLSGLSRNGSQNRLIMGQSLRKEKRPPLPLKEQIYKTEPSGYFGLRSSLSTISCYQPRLTKSSRPRIWRHIANICERRTRKLKFINEIRQSDKGENGPRAVTSAQVKQIQGQIFLVSLKLAYTTGSQLIETSLTCRTSPMAQICGTVVCSLLFPIIFLVWG